MLVVVSFHSLEDKIVKYFFKTYSEEGKNPSRYFPIPTKKDLRLFTCPVKKSIIPSKKEILKNFPSRSAKLRYGIRNEKNFFYPKQLMEKFEDYLEIEKMGLDL